MQTLAAVHADTFSWSDGVPGVAACDFRVRARPGASLRVRPLRARVFCISPARLVYITARGATTRFPVKYRRNGRVCTCSQYIFRPFISPCLPTSRRPPRCPTTPYHTVQLLPTTLSNYCLRHGQSLEISAQVFPSLPRALPRADQPSLGQTNIFVAMYKSTTTPAPAPALAPAPRRTDKPQASQTRTECGLPQLLTSR